MKLEPKELFPPRFTPNSRSREKGRRPVRCLLIPEYISIDRNKNRRARYARAWTRAICVGCVGASRAQIDDGRKKGGAAPRPPARARLEVGVATPSWMKHQQSVASRHPPSHRYHSRGLPVEGDLFEGAPRLLRDSQGSRRREIRNRRVQQWLNLFFFSFLKSRREIELKIFRKFRSIL